MIDEAAIEARDERVKAQIKRAIASRRDDARQLREEAAALELQARRIEEAANAERWYQLGDVISNADIESLCNVSPTDLLGGES